MSTITGYRCTRCDLFFPNGQGGHMYVLDDAGNRVVCPHPGEEARVAHVLGVKERTLRCPFGAEASRGSKRHNSVEVFRLALSRTGFVSDCICRECLARFGLDLRKDERRCPECSSPEVVAVADLVGRACPKCREGTIWKTEPPAVFVPPAFPQR